MYEFLWNGRGGQGAFTAAKILGAAYSLKDENKFSLAFPSFGPERRGAPVKAFTKLSTSKIGDRSEVKNADFEIFLDDTLFNESLLSNLKPNGKVILCSKNTYSNPNIISFDGLSLAQKILKLPITNTVILGAVIAVFKEVSLDDISHAIEQLMPKQLQCRNIEAVTEAYNHVLELV